MATLYRFGDGEFIFRQAIQFIHSFFSCSHINTYIHSLTKAYGEKTQSKRKKLKACVCVCRSFAHKSFVNKMCSVCFCSLLFSLTLFYSLSLSLSLNYSLCVSFCLFRLAYSVLAIAGTYEKKKKINTFSRPKCRVQRQKPHLFGLHAPNKCWLLLIHTWLRTQNCFVHLCVRTHSARITISNSRAA